MPHLPAATRLVIVLAGLLPIRNFSCHSMPAVPVHQCIRGAQTASSSVAHRQLGNWLVMGALTWTLQVSRHLSLSVGIR